MSTNDIPLVHMSSPFVCVSVCVCVCVCVCVHAPITKSMASSNKSYWRGYKWQVFTHLYVNTSPGQILIRENLEHFLNFPTW